jgi:hypothetical protein
MGPFTVFSLRLGSYPCLKILYLCGGLESDVHTSLLWYGVNYGSKSFIETGFRSFCRIVSDEEKNVFKIDTGWAAVSALNKVERFNDTVLGDAISLRN